MSEMKTKSRRLTVISVTLLFFVCVSKLSFGQEKVYGQVSNPDSIIFKDTLNGFVTDSFTSNLGDVQQISFVLKKYFKYIGSDRTCITRHWTEDPHYICASPKDTLVNNKIYEIKICFAFQGKAEHDFYKNMGFNLANEKKITFTFKGHYIPPVNFQKEKEIPENNSKDH